MRLLAWALSINKLLMSVKLGIVDNLVGKFLLNLQERS